MSEHITIRHIGQVKPNKHVIKFAKIEVSNNETYKK